MNDAQLHFRLRVEGFDGFGKALEAIDTGNQDVLDTTIEQIGEYVEPVAGAFRFRDIQAQQLFLACDVQAEDGIDRLADEAPVFLDLVVDGIQPDDGIDGLELPLLPGAKFGYELIGNGVEGAIGRAITESGV